MSVNGRISHCETPARAAHRNETRGNAGDCFPSPKSTMRLLFEPGAVGFFLFLRGRCDEGVGRAIMILARWLQYGPLNSIEPIEWKHATRKESGRRNGLVPKIVQLYTGTNWTSRWPRCSEDQYGRPEVPMGDMPSACRRATCEWKGSCPEVPAKSPPSVHRICWAVPGPNRL
jgi:hypothetical protein